MLVDIGGLTKSTNLDILDSSVQELPEDFGKLQSFVYFYARGCSFLSRLPESVGELAKLETLVLKGCGKVKSPLTSIGGLTKLTNLDISKLGVQEFPENFGKLQTLRYFDASGCSTLSKLPESFD